MSREQNRRVARLNRLADFIQANPKQFDQGHADKCVLGLADRFKNGRLSKAGSALNSWGTFFSNNAYKELTRRYGISYKTCDNIFVGDFNRVNRNFKAKGISQVTPKSAVRMVRYLAKQVAKNGTV